MSLRLVPGGVEPDHELSGPEQVADLLERVRREATDGAVQSTPSYSFARVASDRAVAAVGRIDAGEFFAVAWDDLVGVAEDAVPRGPCQIAAAPEVLAGLTGIPDELLDREGEPLVLKCALMLTEPNEIRITRWGDGSVGPLTSNLANRTRIVKIVPRDLDAAQRGCYEQLCRDGLEPYRAYVAAKELGR